MCTITAGHTLPNRSRRWPNTSDGIATASAQPSGCAPTCQATKTAVVRQIGPREAGRNDGAGGPAQQQPLQNASERHFLGQRLQRNEA